MDSKSEFSAFKSAQILVTGVAFVALSSYLLFLIGYFAYQVASGNFSF